MTVALVVLTASIFVVLGGAVLKRYFDSHPD